MPLDCSYGDIGMLGNLGVVLALIEHLQEGQFALGQFLCKAFVVWVSPVFLARPSLCQ